MESGSNPVAAFLLSLPAFASLSPGEREMLLADLQVHYHRAGDHFVAGEADPGLRVLRKGAMDLVDAEGELVDRLGEGESVHIDNLNAAGDGVIARVIEDTLLCFLPDDTYRALRRGNRDFDRHFTRQRNRRLRRAARLVDESQPLLLPVSGVMSAKPLCVAPGASLQVVAQAMSARRVSSALVTADGIATGALQGIVTDRDLRGRALAAGLPGETPIADIMTPSPVTIDASATVFDATLRIVEQGCHHLPVLREGALVGIVTTTDLGLARQHDPALLVKRLGRAENEETLRELLRDVPRRVAQWVEAGMSVEGVSRLLTAVSDAVTVRLIRLAERDLGAAPGPWCWLGFGSQARGEQLLGGDQDNGIVIADSVAAADRDWYRQLARRVCDGLAACGYPYCPGDVMATTDAWRVPLATWRETVAGWLRTPTPDAVMRVSIFFDLRVIYGDASLGRGLQDTMLELAPLNTIFLAALAENALAVSPPLGLFRRFVVERSGEHRHGVDLKKRGALLITDIARLHALAAGVAAVNTGERLRALSDAGRLALVDSRNLADALHCVQQVRLRHQCAQLAAGKPVNNVIEPRSLPHLAKEQLRDAFTVMNEAQAGARQAYLGGRG